MRVTGMLDRGIPDAQSVAAPAQIRPHDVEAEKRESIIVVDAGNRRGRRAVELADEKAAGVDGGEARGVGRGRDSSPRPPPSRRRAAISSGRHRADAQVCLLVHGIQFPGMAMRHSVIDASVISSSAHALGLQRAADLVEDGGIVDRRRHGPGLAVGDLLHGAAQDLARAGLGQPRHRDRRA